MKLTTEILVIGCGCTAEVAGQWLEPMQAAVTKFGIDKNPQRLASFLANVGVESDGLTKFEENLYYTDPARLAVVWPTRFAIDSHMVKKMPNQAAYQYTRKPEALANFVYADRLGNGPVSSGDGWKYRGQGPIQLTGATNIKAFFKAAGLPEDTDTEELHAPEVGSLSAAWFYAEGSKACAAADNDDFDGTVKAVNGNPPCAANQGPLRRSRYNAVLEPLMATPSAPSAPVKTVPAPAVKKAATTPAATPQATPKQ